MTQTILPPKTKRADAESIISEVCNMWDVTRDQIMSRNRTQPLAFSRQVAMSLCRQHARMSLQEIGELFNGRDHTTAIYAQDRVDAEMAKSERVTAIIQTIIKNLTKTK